MLIDLIFRFFDIEKTYHFPFPKEILLEKLSDLKVSSFGFDYTAKRQDDSVLFELVYDFNRSAPKWFLLTPHSDRGDSFISLKLDISRVATAYLILSIVVLFFFLFLSIKIIIDHSSLWLIAVLFGMLSLFLLIGAFLWRFALDAKSELFMSQIEKQLKQ